MRQNQSAHKSGERRGKVLCATPRVMPLGGVSAVSSTRTKNPWDDRDRWSRAISIAELQTEQGSTVQNCVRGFTLQSNSCPIQAPGAVLCPRATDGTPRTDAKSARSPATGVQKRRNGSAVSRAIGAGRASQRPCARAEHEPSKRGPALKGAQHFLYCAAEIQIIYARAPRRRRKTDAGCAQVQKATKKARPRLPRLSPIRPAARPPAPLAASASVARPACRAPRRARPRPRPRDCILAPRAARRRRRAR